MAAGVVGTACTTGSDGWRCGRYCWYGGAALGKLVCAIGLADGTDVDALNGDTDCVEVERALGKLVNALAEIG
jgi:hypothetical protein